MRAVLEEAIGGLEITLTKPEGRIFWIIAILFVRTNNVNLFLQNVLRKSMLNYLSIKI